MAKAPDLSIVIGSYNNKKLTIDCLNSIFSFTRNLNFEIILIDDRSPDDIYQIAKKNFPKIRVYQNEKNFRYSKTYNRGSRLSKGKYILHMNADMLFTKDTKLNELVSFMDSHPDVGMLGDEVQDYRTRKLDPDNRHQVPTLINGFGQSLGLYKLFPGIKPLNYYMTYLKDDQVAEVGGIGGFMLFRKELLKDVGFLDEKFKIYCQDSDFCYRVIQKGWKIIYYPRSKSVHIGAGSVKRFEPKNQIIFHQDLLRYYKKNLTNKYPFFVEYFIVVALGVRLVVFTVFEIFKELRIKL